MREVDMWLQERSLFVPVDMHKSHCQKRQHFKIPSCMTPNSLPPFTMQELLARTMPSRLREKKEEGKESPDVGRAAARSLSGERYSSRAHHVTDKSSPLRPSVWSVSPPVRQSCIIGRRRRRPWRDPNGRTEKPFRNIFANE